MTDSDSSLENLLASPRVQEQWRADTGLRITTVSANRLSITFSKYSPRPRTPLFWTSVSEATKSSPESVKPLKNLVLALTGFASNE